jgi:hypothetical protein
VGGKHCDGLFLCIQRIVLGPVDKNTEIELKMNIVKWAADNRIEILAQSQLNNKLSATKLQEYTADFMSCPKLTWGALYLMCLFYKINVRVIHKCTFMDFYGGHVDTPWHRIVREGQFFRLEESDRDGDKIPVDFRQSAPMRAQGHYKVHELKNLASLLGLEPLVAPKNKKQDWYDAVYREMAW